MRKLRLREMKKIAPNCSCGKARIHSQTQIYLTPSSPFISLYPKGLLPKFAPKPVLCPYVEFSEFLVLYC
jgi:hypothetical protein